MERIRKALGGTIQAIASIVETRDPYTAGHQRRVADLSRAIATEMGLTPDRIDGIRTAGTIHDIGKICVPAEILSMPRKLTKIEIDTLKSLGFVDTSDSVPWRDAYPECSEEQLIGKALAGARFPAESGVSYLTTYLCFLAGAEWN